jgi:hypothetical protein
MFAGRIVVHNVCNSLLCPVVVLILIEVVPNLAIRSPQLIGLVTTICILDRTGHNNLYLGVLTRVQLKGLFEKGSVVTGFDKFLIAEPA